MGSWVHTRPIDTAHGQTGARPLHPPADIEPVPVYVDYEFSFTVVNGKGIVRGR